MENTEPLTPVFAVKKIVSFLTAKKIEGNLKFEAEVMVSEALNCDRLGIYLKYNMLLNHPEKETLRDFIRKRVKGMPLAYILEKTFFYGKEFTCLPGVLIPRPDTEELVFRTLETMTEYREIFDKNHLDILEVGCGSGVISLMLALEERDTHFTMTDSSAVAVENTTLNAEKFQHAITANKNTLTVERHDILTGDFADNSFDLIVSNPPYVSESEYGTLPSESREHEPAKAFIGGTDGLDFYRCFSTKLEKYLRKDGYLLLECGYNQMKPIQNIFDAAGYWKLYKTFRDINKKDRVMIFKLHRNTKGQTSKINGDKSSGTD